MNWLLADESRCPRCRRPVTAALDSDHPPCTGDVIVCVQCGGVLTLTKGLAVRELRDDEFRRLPVATILQIVEMQRRLAHGDDPCRA
jgi:hypothetical protein